MLQRQSTEIGVREKMKRLGGPLKFTGAGGRTYRAVNRCFGNKPLGMTESAMLEGVDVRAAAFVLANLPPQRYESIWRKPTRDLWN